MSEAVACQIPFFGIDLRLLHGLPESAIPPGSTLSATVRIAEYQGIE
jgi:hypothetical protein